ncbi:MAG: PPOX class F420-dependent oxidoreductase [Candidatus Hodarchaeales archaeon]|jgi:PPOX class probable F420-dependent enzyme
MSTKYEKILEKKGFAHLATIMPDGSPQSTPVWYDTEEGLIRINTAIDRVKDRNLRVRSKVALSILDPENPYSFIGIRGEVVERTTENADPHIDLLAKKYLGADTYPYRTKEEIRVLYKIKPLSIFGLN